MIFSEPPLKTHAQNLLQTYREAERADDPKAAMDAAYELVSVACTLHSKAWERKRTKEGKR